MYTNGDELNFIMCFNTGAECSGAESNSETTSANLLANAWYHLAITFDTDASPALVMYVNGAPVAFNTTGESTLTSDLLESDWPVYIGEFIDGQPTDGVIDDVRIYNRALTPAEILQLYRLGQVRVTQ